MRIAVQMDSGEERSILLCSSSKLNTMIKISYGESSETSFRAGLSDFKSTSTKSDCKVCDDSTPPTLRTYSRFTSSQIDVVLLFSGRTQLCVTGIHDLQALKVGKNSPSSVLHANDADLRTH
ncbi:hypothetical protein J6590_087219 [Homalodisca vitripennis]|nr:hypothetical protein J6590_087219 [Homalodisca vitripennis]